MPDPEQSAIAIRPAHAGDAPAIAVLMRAVRRAALPWLPDLHTPDDDRGFVRDRLLPRCAVWVAASPGTGPRGFIAFADGWVEQLWVDPAWQGRGLGTRLLATAQAAHTHLQLWVFQRNRPAIAFYAARGFRLVRLTDGRDNEEREPDALYEWTASP
jgi:GNAT superfamily N-acetyltransferase